MMHCGSLFSGGGLADLGLVAAGYTPVFGVEYDAAIAECYAANVGPHVTVGRVEEQDYRGWTDLDLAWASPSCVRASVANANAGETEEDRKAAAAVCRSLWDARPARFVLENVSGYRAWESFRMIVRTLLELGYAVDWGLHNAADYGVPQTRRRLILRALRDARYVPPLCPTYDERPMSAGLFEEVSPLLPWQGWYAAVEDLLDGLPESRFAAWQLARLPESLGTYLVGGSNTSDEQAAPGVGVSGQAEPARCVAGNSDRWRAVLVDNGNPNRNGGIVHTANQPCVTVLAQADRVPLRAFLVEDRRASGFANETVRASDTPPRAWLEQGRVVQMNARCLARFQSVPDSYALPEKNKTAYRVIGNGVPPLFSQRIAESLHR